MVKFLVEFLLGLLFDSKTINNDKKVVNYSKFIIRTVLIFSMFINAVLIERLFNLSKRVIELDVKYQELLAINKVTKDSLNTYELYDKLNQVNTVCLKSLTLCEKNISIYKNSNNNNNSGVS